MDTSTRSEHDMRAAPPTPGYARDVVRHGELRHPIDATRNRVEDRPETTREPELTRIYRAPSRRVGSKANVLSARDFQGCLERERSLADRGSRRFSVLALVRSVGAHDKRRTRDALAEFVECACKRLRSTDLVGRFDARRIEILLTDTEPAGAHVVAAWIAQLATKLELEFECTIYVYPSAQTNGGATESDAAALAADERTEPNANGNGHARGVSCDEFGARRAASPMLGEHGTLRRAERWPTKDLWPLLEIPTPLWKRALDVPVSAVALIAMLPLILVVAIAVRLDSPGPVIFRQLRAGRGGTPFVFYKFRSMTANAEAQRLELASRNEQNGPVFKILEDPRITRVGRWLRRWSIDELPQLWNVLKGDISLVGPRSPTLDEVTQYERWQRRRLSVTGGITCTWQVSGRNQIPFREWMRLDMRYVARRTLWLDLRLLALTVPAVALGRGAC